MSKMRATGRLLALGALALASVAAMPLQLLIVGPVFKNRNSLQKMVNKSGARIMGLKVHFNGAVENKKPAIYIANHMSYLDIPVLGGTLKGSFIAKAGIAKWPLIGLMGKAFDNIFIERTKKHLPIAHKNMHDRLNNGRNIILFPEGTTTDGKTVTSFKAGLLSIAFNKVAGEKDPVPLRNEVRVQPVAIRPRSINGEPVHGNPALLEKYTWYGDQNVLTHIWRTLQTKSMDIDVAVFPALDPKDFKDYKDLVNHAHRQVRDYVTAQSPAPVRP